MYDHRNWQQSVQAEGHAAALNGTSREDNPYGQSLPGYNLWIYGYMLGAAEARKERANVGG